MVENIQRAYYIKLGKGGEYEESSIQNGLIRIGWHFLSLDEINGKEWEKIKQNHTEEYTTKGTATMDINALSHIVESTPDDVWITFYSSYLWWCRVGEPTIHEDSISKYRKVSGVWKNTDIHGHPLIINQISGRLSELQMFRATICHIEDEKLEDLKRLINDEPSSIYRAIEDAKVALISKVAEGIRQLHPKDFEILVDLVFSKTWNRVSVVGGIMRDVDIELKDPIAGDMYQVQIKSSASKNDFEDYVNRFSHARKDFRRFYFVIHDPDLDLATYQNNLDNVELILPQRLSEMVVEAGLTSWLLKKIK